jgi:hypothetical protein
MTKTFTSARMPVAEKKDASVRTHSFGSKPGCNALQCAALAGIFLNEEILPHPERVAP